MRDPGESVLDSGSPPPSAPQFRASDYRQSQFPRLERRPLIGANYTHYEFRNCTFDDTNILLSYHLPGVAERVHAQLLQMRRAGIATIRTVIWHTTDAGRHTWGVVSSGGGKLHEPNRTNLIRFLTEIRKFGFARFTAVFEPKYRNSPLLRRYEPARFRENWRFIRAVRSLVKRYGPAKTRIDLSSEGAPNEKPTKYEPVPRQTGRYLSRLYRLYVRRFGNRDVTISAIANPAGPTNRVQNLVRILKTSGEPLPRWYDVHIGADPAVASNALWHADASLTREGQSQPLVIGDVGYDQLGVARVIRRFLERSSRRIEEISPWPVRITNGCELSPPYVPGAYERELHPK
jgi:hypothetical protein